MPFPHKTVLITGATAGIGRALAERMVQNGITVIAVGRRKDRLDDLVEKYGADKLVAEEFDVTDLDAIPAWAEKCVCVPPPLYTYPHLFAFTFTSFSSHHNFISPSPAGFLSTLINIPYQNLHREIENMLLYYRLTNLPSKKN